MIIKFIIPTDSVALWLIPLAKSSQLELNRAVLEFAEYLLQEHNLGMAEDIQSRIHELNRLARKLELAACAPDADLESMCYEK